MKISSKHIIVLLFSAMATMTDAAVPGLRRQDAVESSTTVFATHAPPNTSNIAGESATTTQFVRRQDAALTTAGASAAPTPMSATRPEIGGHIRPVPTPI
ncbi:hypothetical protein BG011_004352 [Mortierella polycephala]|uniref:Uncharacterized protein n=1 Tax=Mortierella polycephala TaxID=41804 RepID=A0A9P6Q1S1_9FUNG|nr:hypothetical protein BG011_004352 [Mortierella polycephala]